MVRYTTVSSANRLTWDYTLSGRSFMYSRNKIGRRMEPCGTSEDTGTSSITHLLKNSLGSSNHERLDPMECLTLYAVHLQFVQELQMVDLFKGLTKIE